MKPNLNNILFIDFETTLNKKKGLDIKKLGLRQYILNPEVKVLCLGNIYSDNHSVIDMNNASFPMPLYLGPICSHNAKFDGGVLEWKLNVRPSYYFDTLSMARAVLGTKVSDYSLATLAKYFGFPAKKEINLDGLTQATPEMIEYCKHDIWLCKEIFICLAQEFPENLYDLVDLNIKSFLRPKLRLNKEIIQNALYQEKIRRETIIFQSGITRSTLSSNKKLGELLSESMAQIPTKKSPRTGKQIPALALGDVQFHELEKINKPLYDARIAAKSNLLETRLEKLLKMIEVTGSNEYAFDLLFSGAHTHRDSGGSGWGGNPQNFTRDSALREAIEPQNDYNLFVGDLAQIELRILAWLADDPRLIKMLSNNEDVYADFASDYYKFSITKEHKQERQFGKIAVLGLGYGMGAKHFREVATLQLKKEITVQEARRAVDLYRTRYFAIPKLWNMADQWLKGMVSGYTMNLGFLILKKESIILPSGLKLHYCFLQNINGQMIYSSYDHKSKKLQQKNIWGGMLIENICQAIAGEILREIQKRILVNQWLKFVGAVHDEVLCVSKIKNTQCILQSIMETPLSWWPELKLKAEVKTGKNWLECK